MRVLVFLSVLCLALALSGCVALDSASIKELVQSDASVCVSSDVRGGAGGIVGGATGGYGQGTLYFCRSKMPNARITLKPDGSMSIEHGEGVAE